MTGSLTQQNQFFQKQFKRGEACCIHDEIQEMRSRKIPLDRRMEKTKDETQEKRIERTPIGIDSLVQTEASGAPGNFDIRNAVWGHLIAVRPHPQESQSQGHAPKKDSQVVGGRRNCGSGSFLAFRLRAVQKLHSSSAEKFNRSKREDYVRTLATIGRRNVAAKEKSGRRGWIATPRNSLPIYPMCRSSAFVICSLGTAPTICSTTCPFLNSSSVGIP